MTETNTNTNAETNGGFDQDEMDGVTQYVRYAKRMEKIGFGALALILLGLLNVGMRVQSVAELLDAHKASVGHGEIVQIVRSEAELNDEKRMLIRQDLAATTAKLDHVIMTCFKNHADASRRSVVSE